MESQTGSVIPGIISKQELLFAGTMIEITNMVELTANAFNVFGKNIKTIKDRVISYNLYDSIRQITVYQYFKYSIFLLIIL